MSGGNTYSAEQLAWLKANRTLSQRDCHAAFLGAFPGSCVSIKGLSKARSRRGWWTGRSGQFTAGQLPHNAHALGAGSVDERGRVWVSAMTSEGRPSLVLKHVHAWEAANGPIPEDHVLKCLDGDRSNCDPSNWAAIPRAILARLNGGRWKKRVPYDEAAEELRPTVLALAQVEHRLMELRRGEGA